MPGGPSSSSNQTCASRAAVTDEDAATRPVVAGADIAARRGADRAAAAAAAASECSGPARSTRSAGKRKHRAIDVDADGGSGGRRRGRRGVSEDMLDELLKRP